MYVALRKSSEIAPRMDWRLFETEQNEQNERDERDERDGFNLFDMILKEKPKMGPCVWTSTF